MKQPIYRRDYQKSSLVFEKEWADHVSYFQLEMLLENDIKGLLSCSSHSFNGEDQIYYDITGKQTLACIYEKKQMKETDVERLLFGIRDVLLQLQEYLLDENKLLLQPEYIYIDLSTKEISFCFYPFWDGNLSQAFMELAEYLLEKIDHEREEAVVAAYQFYRLVKEENSSFIRIMEELYKADGKIEKEEQYEAEHMEKFALGNEIRQQEEEFLSDVEAVRQAEWEEEIMPRTLEEDVQIEEGKKERGLFYVAFCLIVGGLSYGGYFYCADYAAMMRPWQDFCTTTRFYTAAALVLLGIVFWGFSFYFYRMKRKQMGDLAILEQSSIEQVCEDFVEESEYGKEEVTEKGISQEAGGEMTVLLAENCYREERCLVSTDRRKYKILLTDFPFIIGKMEGAVDYVLQDKSVSRMHVKFIYNEEEDTVYIQDLNSTNGTFHNGARLGTNEILPIYAEDEIRIGKCVFVYQ